MCVCVYLWWKGESPCFLFRPAFFLAACSSSSCATAAASTPGSGSGLLCPGRSRSGDDTEGAADGCVGAWEAVGAVGAVGRGCFLGRPGRLLFTSPPALLLTCCAGALLCCPRWPLQSPCKAAVIQEKKKKTTTRGKGKGGMGGGGGGNETDVDE